jgi:hypothetical protein
METRIRQAGFYPSWANASKQSACGQNTQIAIWRGFSAIFGLEGSPVLVFTKILFTLTCINLLAPMWRNVK